MGKSKLSDTAMNEVRGIRLATAAAGIKKNSNTDMVLIEAATGSSVAAVFTQNRFCAAPVQLAKQHLVERDADCNDSQPLYLLINSGNANAGTGAQGLAIAAQACELLSDKSGCKPSSVLPFSTGVIGEQLNIKCFESSIPGLLNDLKSDSWLAAAEGIMTTDTVAKVVSRQFEMFGESYTLTGICKGAGMICPNMATMLAYLATDLAVDSNLLQHIISEAVETSFNRITIDGDTSTNDAAVLLSTGLVPKPGLSTSMQQSDEYIKPAQTLHSRDQQEFQAFSALVTEACINLAQQIIRDGEGATKFVTIDVEQGQSEADCLAVAYTIAHSPLVKTALFASDPNWGRILAAVGRAPIAELNVDAVSLYIGDVLIAECGAVATNYNESDASTVMQQTDISILIKLGAGDAKATVWTTDLSHDYVSINADYRS